MSEQENTERLKALYAAFGRGDIATVLEGSTDDVEFVVAGASDVPHVGTHRGKQAVGTWFGTIGGTFEFQVFEPREFIAQGDTVVAVVYTEVTVRRTGRKVASDEVHIFTFRDGKVSRFRLYQDTAAVAAAYSGA